MAIVSCRHIFPNNVYVCVFCSKVDLYKCCHLNKLFLQYFCFPPERNGRLKAALKEGLSWTTRQSFALVVNQREKIYVKFDFRMCLKSSCGCRNIVHDKCFGWAEACLHGNKEIGSSTHHIWSLPHKTFLRLRFHSNCNRPVGGWWACQYL